MEEDGKRCILVSCSILTIIIFIPFPVLCLRTFHVYRRPSPSNMNKSLSGAMIWSCMYCRSVLASATYLPDDRLPPHKSISFLMRSFWTSNEHHLNNMCLDKASCFCTDTDIMSCHKKMPQTIELELAIIFLQKLSQSDLGFKRYINITTKRMHVFFLFVYVHWIMYTYYLVVVALFWPSRVLLEWKWKNSSLFWSCFFKSDPNRTRRNSKDTK